MSGRMRRSNRRELSDETLMAAYRDGDAVAFEELFRRYESRAYGFFLKRTASPERAQDLYQELFLRVHRARDRYDPARPFCPCGGHPDPGAARGPLNAACLERDRQSSGDAGVTFRGRATYPSSRIADPLPS